MKKLFVLVVCLTIMGIQSVNAQAAIAMLHHEGNVNMYSSAQAAIDNSVDGDTIYLSEGLFGEFTINKGIAVIGSGIKTVVGPNIYIGDTGSESVNNVTVSNLSIIGKIEFLEGAVTNNVKIRQCKTAGDCNFVGTATNVEIALCHIHGFICPNPNSTDILTVINSKIGAVRYGGKDYGSVNFVNCNIGGIDIYDAQERNNYINCYIGTTGKGNYKNCLYSNGSGGVLSDCFYYGDYLLDDNLNSIWTDDQLSSAGYLGTDGTVVGITGGAVPFTLASSVLRITDHNIEVDNEQRKLKVTLTLGTEE